ncbi:FHA domain-containing protein [Glaciecola sp. SC05]|uniref:FHA domain-containing protein n=1 Tax=Glaciecola sp. SC05 TaxID=1987355 RepID=UPI003528E2B6
MKQAISTFFSFQKRSLKLIWLCALCVMAPSALAKNWQIMLIPDGHSSPAVLSSENINAVIRDGISTKLIQELDQIVASDRVFANCDINLCGKNSVQEVLTEVAQQAPDVELVLFYGLFKHANDTSLRVSLIDPLSFQNYESFELKVLSGNDGNEVRQQSGNGASGIDQGQLKSLATDLGQVISQRLQSVVQRNDFALILKGFTLDEVAPFSTFVLTATTGTKLTLTKSQKQSGRLSAYFPVMETHFSVSSSLTQSQFNQLLIAFFDERNIDIVNEYQRQSNEFVVSRLGNPYTPSLISSLLLFLAAALLLVLLVKRQMFHYKLENYAQLKSVDKWLAVYEQARSPWFALQKKWGNQYSYWQRLQRESNELEKQAKLFFEAGDVTTAKLFISKALNLNSDAALAKSLIDKIATQESSQKAFSEKEQWVRNKVAKAMNNYRNNQPIKALRQAYQALHESALEKKLKRQHKAIKRLVQKINVDFVQTHHYLELTDLNTSDTCVISSLSQLELGRYQGAEAPMPSTHIINAGIRFYINHKALSRVGKQCKVLMRGDGFFLEDSGSTNGTFLKGSKAKTDYLDGKQLIKHTETALTNGDTIYLGANSELSAVKLEVAIDKSSSLLQINISKQLQHTLDMAELARAWPDYMQTMRASLVLCQADFVLALDLKTDKLRILSLDDLQQKKKHVGLARIWLGQTASLAPLVNETTTDEEALWCNDERLYGIVPLVLPCELKYKQQHVLIDEYLQDGPRRRRNNADTFQLQSRDAEDA